MASHTAVGKLKLQKGKHSLNRADGCGGGVQRPIRPWQESTSAANELSSILHDLRNPLATISGGVEMLLGANLDGVQTQRVTTNIQQATGRMQDLLGALESMTRGDAEAVAFCNLRAIVMAACEAAGVADRGGIEVFLSVPARLEIAVRRKRVVRVFLNLIVNAMEAMPSGGAIQITASEEGDSVRVVVEDTGPGIAAEIRGRLFEPFVTAGKKAGMGLGLTFCRQTIRDHCGELRLEAANGARFVLILPYSQPLPRQRAMATI